MCTGCNDGLIPLVRSQDDTNFNLDEETRLFFVSMTRARRILRLLHTAWHVTHGHENKRPNRPSRFLSLVMQSETATSIDEVKQPNDTSLNELQSIAHYNTNKSRNTSSLEQSVENNKGSNKSRRLPPKNLKTSQKLQLKRYRR